MRFCHIKSLIACIITLVALLGSTVQAATTADDIYTVASTFTAEYEAELKKQYGPSTRIETKISPLDPRLALADCPAPLNSTMKAGGSNRINLKVSCDEGKRWSVYVPVTINTYRQVITSLRPIPRGTTIQATDLKLSEMNTSQLRGSYFTNTGSLTGMVAKQMINSGAIILDHHIVPPVIIKKGDAVLVTAKTSGLLVKMPGIALTDGREGDQIRVKNKQSQRTIEARVTGPGQVKVLM